MSEVGAVQLYDVLWSLAEVRGAVSAAGKLKHAQAYAGRLEQALDATEPAAVRVALGKISGV